jgi:hypothetical protein
MNLVLTKIQKQDKVQYIKMLDYEYRENKTEESI